MWVRPHGGRGCRFTVRGATSSWPTPRRASYGPNERRVHAATYGRVPGRLREGSEKVPSKHCSTAYTSRANTHQRRCVSAAEGVCSRALIGVQESVCSPSSRPPTPSPEPTAMRYEWLVERGTPEKKKRPKL